MKAVAERRSSARPNAPANRDFSAASSRSQANSEPDHAATDIADLRNQHRRPANQNNA
jgi:hypothetical protein